METKEKIVDRRVQRTRHLLHQALKQLLKEKSFQALTVHDITERATLNRGTFYLHFTDKYALLDDYLREEFHQVLPPQLFAPDALSLENIRLLILTVMDYLAQTYDQCRPVDKPIAPVLEVAVQQEIYRVLVKWLNHAQVHETPLLARAETIATVISWAIFGVGTQWSQSTRGVTAEAMAHQVMAVLVNGLSSMATLTRWGM